MSDNTNNMANSQTPTGVSIHSGFPNPAEDFAQQSALALNLNQLLVQNPTSTYLFRIRGHHWSDNGIFDGDIAIIDRSLTPSDQDIVLTWDYENFVLSRRQQLSPEQSIWGVVAAIVHPRSQQTP